MCIREKYTLIRRDRIYHFHREAVSFPGENILVIDDFLANGRAVLGLLDIAVRHVPTFQALESLLKRAFNQEEKCCAARESAWSPLL